MTMKTTSDAEIYADPCDLEIDKGPHPVAVLAHAATGRGWEQLPVLIS